MRQSGSSDCIAEGYWPTRHSRRHRPDPVGVIASVRIAPHFRRGRSAAWPKKFPSRVTSSRFKSSCLRNPPKGDDDDTTTEPLHRQSRSNATVDRPRKNDSKRWSGAFAEGTCHDALLADQRMRLLHPLSHIRCPQVWRDRGTAVSSY